MKRAAFSEHRVLRTWAVGEGRRPRGAEWRGRSDRVRGWQAQAWACHWNVFLLRGAVGGIRRRRKPRERKSCREKAKGEEEKQRVQEWKEQASAEKWTKRLPAKWETSSLEAWKGRGRQGRKKWRLHFRKDWQDDMKADCCCRVEAFNSSTEILTLVQLNYRVILLEILSAHRWNEASSFLTEDYKQTCTASMMCALT